MQTKSTSGRYLKRAEQIGNTLIANAIKSTEGLHWKTSVEIPGKQPYVIETADIYSGASGIALFFIELYKSTLKTIYLNIAKNAMRWVVNYANNNDWNQYSFYYGRLGVSYVLMQLYELTKDHTLQLQAEALSKGSVRFLDTNPGCDLLSGVAGTILGLIHLHTFINKSWVLSEIATHTNYLLSRVEFGEIGIYWDRSGNNSKGLCGLSHGASGIAFALLELSHYFNNPSYSWLAHQAFKYEDKFYDSSKHNWPDFRKLYDSDVLFKQATKAYESNNLDFFRQTSFMYAWCHGGLGISLARIRGSQLLQRQALLKQANESLLYNKYCPGYDFGLCHGLAGVYECSNILRHLNHNQINMSPNYTEMMQNMPIESRSTDLFNGIAGMGYSLINTVAETRHTSVMLPIVTNTLTDTFLGESIETIEFRLLSKLYPKTLTLCSETEKTKIIKQLGYYEGDIQTYSYSLLDSSLSKTAPARYMFEVETIRNKQNNKYSDSLLLVQRTSNIRTAKNLLNLKTKDFNNTFVRLIPQVKLINRQKKYYVVRPTEQGSKISEVDYLTYLTLRATKRGAVISNIIEYVLTKTATSSYKSKQSISSIIKETLNLGIASIN